MLRRLFYQTQLLTNCQFLGIPPNLMIKCPSMCLQKAHKSFEVLGVHEVPVLTVANQAGVSFAMMMLCSITDSAQQHVGTG